MRRVTLFSECASHVVYYKKFAAQLLGVLKTPDTSWMFGEIQRRGESSGYLHFQMRPRRYWFAAVVVELS